MFRFCLLLAVVVLLVTFPVSGAFGITHEEMCQNMTTPVVHDGLGMVLVRMLISQDDFLRTVGFDPFQPYRDTGVFHTVYHVRIVNLTGEMVHFNYGNFKIIVSSGATVPPDSWTFQTRRPFPAVDVDPGGFVEGFVVFPEYGAVESVVYDDGERRVQRDASDGLIIRSCLE